MKVGALGGAGWGTGGDADRVDGGCLVSAGELKPEVAKLMTEIYGG